MASCEGLVQEAGTQTDSPSCCAAVLSQLQAVQRELFQTRRSLREAQDKPAVMAVATQTSNSTGQRVAGSSGQSAAANTAAAEAGPSQLPRPDFSSLQCMATYADVLADSNSNTTERPASFKIKEECGSDRFQYEYIDPAAEFTDSEEDDPEDAVDCKDAARAEEPSNDVAGQLGSPSQPLLQPPVQPHDLGPHCCQGCSLSFASAAAERRHKHHIHGEPRQIQCHGCHQLFDDRPTLLAHKRTVCSQPSPARRRRPSLVRRPLHSSSSPLHHCTHCSRSFYSTAGARRHIRYAHLAEEKTFVCPTCGKAFRQRKLLQAHRQCHTGEGLFKEQKPEQDMQLQERALEDDPPAESEAVSPGPRFVNCSLCDQQFASAEELRSHIRQTHHGEERMFPCRICGRAFRQKTLQLAHEESHPGGVLLKQTQKADQEAQEAEQPTGKPGAASPCSSNSSCFRCSQQFASGEEVQRHIRETHFGDRTMGRSSLGKRPVSRGSLQSPQRVCCCPICGKAFSSVVALQSHAVLAREKGLHS